MSAGKTTNALFRVTCVSSTLIKLSVTFSLKSTVVWKLYTFAFKRSDYPAANNRRTYWKNILVENELPTFTIEIWPNHCLRRHVNFCSEGRSDFRAHFLWKYFSLFRFQNLKMFFLNWSVHAWTDRDWQIH